MIVWLEGHEPYVAEFCLGADQAMERLGIKRSRLNQISGKELRVGRIKSGRYIKPMYREQDIAAYLEWTRPTASHQASKRALESVTANIDERLSSLAERIGEQLSRSTRQYGHLHKTVAVDIAEWLEPVLAGFHRELDSIKRELDASAFERQQLSAAVHRHSRSAKARAEQLERSTLDIKHAIEMSQQSLNLAARLEAQNSYLTERMTAMAKEITAQIASHISASVGEKLDGAARDIAILKDRQEQFATTDFPGIAANLQQGSHDALLGHIDQQIARLRQDLSLPAEGHRAALTSKPKGIRRGHQRSYRSSIRKKPSFPSHRG